jgi:exodeoxyribonuclease VII large subunit
MQPDLLLAPARVLTVGELTLAIQAALSMSFPMVWVSGEVSGMKRHQNGHIYFTLKDNQATLPCVVWRTAAKVLETSPQDGDQIEVLGRLDLYPPHGRYQFVAENIRPCGRGQLYAAFEQLKAKLFAEGLFDDARKRPIPKFPRCIGLVTSPSGAAIRDMLKIILSKDPKAHVLLSPALVQGRGAAPSICSALSLIARSPLVDVVIVGRGGGAIEDLWAFNEESVARAIIAHPVPVVSAVGHESDFTIADLVADVRAATPSHAADMVTPHRERLELEVYEARVKLLRAIKGPLSEARAELNLLIEQLPDLEAQLEQHRTEIEGLSYRLRTGVRQQLQHQKNQNSLLQQRLERAHPRARVASQRASFSAVQARLYAAYRAMLLRQRERFQAQKLRNEELQQRLLLSSEHRRNKHWEQLGQLAGRLHALSPLATLRRGYALLEPGRANPDDPPITRAASVSKGQQIRLRLYDGDIHCVVQSVEKKG